MSEGQLALFDFEEAVTQYRNFEDNGGQFHVRDQQLEFLKFIDQYSKGEEPIPMEVEKKPCEESNNASFLYSMLAKKAYKDSAGYWATEVPIFNLRWREHEFVDLMRFVPNSKWPEEYEGGIFTAYEVKSNWYDYQHSGGTLTFVGDYNYFVCPAFMAKDLGEEYKKKSDIGIMIPVPDDRTVEEEADDPTPLDEHHDWNLKKFKKPYQRKRGYSNAYLLCCMMRSYWTTNKRVVRKTA